ncbi:MAG: thioesterase family protein [Actinomycetota bacterium]|nr:thioesterase family protein [Actinomycetota bacterium]
MSGHTGHPGHPGVPEPLLAVLDLVALERVAADRFVSLPLPGNGPRLGGSELLTAALLASAATARAELAPSGAQASFLRSGRSDLPVDLTVAHLQDSRSSAVRAVTASQGGTPVMTASFRCFLPRHAPDWQPEMVFDVPPHDGEEQLALVATLPALRSFEVRAAVRPPDGRQVIHPYWIKSRQPLADDALLHAAVLLYLTDVGTSGSARAPHMSLRERMAPVSLDHTFWWHRSVRVDHWLRVDARSLTESGGRALARGEVVRADGVLAASFAQEVVVPEPRPTA